MGSQYSPEAQRPATNVSEGRQTEGRNLQEFADYIREMIPYYMRETAPYDERRGAPLSRNREERYLADDREAMHFYSESNMR